MNGVIGVLISVIVTLIVLGIIWWAVQQLLPLLPIGEPFLTIIRVLLTVILVLIVLWVLLTLLGAAGVHVGGPFHWSGIPGGSFVAAAARTAVDLPGVLNG
jgi:hypothetical protein